MTRAETTEPGLPNLSPYFIARFLAYLSDCGVSDATPSPLLGGRSNLVWRLGGIVVKLYGDSHANPLFANDAAREYATLQALNGIALVPELLTSGQFEGHDWLAYRHSPGVTWSSGTAEVAALLGRLHAQPVIPSLPIGVSGSEEIKDQTRSILAYCGDAGDLNRLEPGRKIPAAGRKVLIHGDPVPGNIVTSGGCLTLIDWQCPQIGDPAEDLALFLSPAMQQVYRGAPLTGAEEATFLAAYPEAEITQRYLLLKPWFHWRMTAYCQWRDERDGDQNSLAYRLERAALEACLEHA
ncbi:thiamine kinase ThiK-like protein [Phaeobacter inhibens]|uniref:phosphotransferase family protein n=1 Tax=Phaeobacter inhibens TaxID=221822 RepID=UPI000C9CD6A3|nr:aminoglycoside phosphotransferase family protein [Phaeobacter inhibens]AUR05601.1 thiamine kinase ThiK-like protein [Phaeobacter inhibens]